MRFRRSFLVSSLALTSACSQGRSPAARETLKTDSQPIVGGIVDPGHGYVVGIGDGTSGVNGAFCTGTVISRRTVLTAGHCFDSSFGANGGIGGVDFGTDLATAQVVKVTKATLHPAFDNNSLANDLTIIELAADSPIQPAPLLRETMANTPEWIGPDFTFVGYGDINGNNVGFGTRRVALFPLVAMGPKQVGGTAGTIEASQFYYATKGKNTCSGDSGGPAFAVRANVEHLAGSTSYGDGPCKVDGVDGRTDLPAIMGFIQAQIDANEGADPCRSDGVCDETCNTGPNLVDPDCAQNHCAKDGICALSCVQPVDPDCQESNPVNLCGPDGVCDPTCMAPDSDCPAGTGGAGGGSAGGAGGASAGGSGGAAAGGAATGGAAGAAAGGSATGGSAGASAGGSGGAATGGAGGAAAGSGGVSAGGAGGGAGGVAGAGGTATGGHAGTAGSGGSAQAGAGGTGGHAGSAGHAGTGGSATGGAGGAKAGAGGAAHAGSAGAKAATGGASIGTGGGDTGGGGNPDTASDDTSSDSGGCDIAGTRNVPGSAGWLAAAVSLLWVGRRRRRA